MIYQIVSDKAGNRHTGQWDGRFAPAKERAWQLMESGEADEVAIYGDIGRLRFHCPRILRRL